MLQTSQSVYGGRVVPGRALLPLRSAIRDRRGMGDATSVVMSAPAIVGGVLTTTATSAAAASAASVAVGGAASTAFLASSLAVPIIGAVVAGVTLALLAIFSRKGPKQKVATTKIVNEVEPLLQQNLSGYMSGPRTVSSQSQALENFKAGWQYVVDNCDVPVMGDPGKACVRDRNRGGQWDWWSYYYDPIYNDTQVVHDSTALTGGAGTVAGVITQLTSGTVGGIPMPLILAGAAVLLLMTMGGGKR